MFNGSPRGVNGGDDSRSTSIVAGRHFVDDGWDGAILIGVSIVHKMWEGFGGYLYPQRVTISREISQQLRMGSENIRA